MDTEIAIGIKSCANGLEKTKEEAQHLQVPYLNVPNEIRKTKWICLELQKQCPRINS
jgi:hypothetical protein